VTAGPLYPETAAGGFTRRDGTVAFYTRVNALVKAADVVLDLGAGRGSGLVDDPVPYRRELRRLQGKCAKLIGADVDPAVLTHPALDEAHIIQEDGPLPFDDGAIDLIVADFVLEHVKCPDPFASEVARVLAPGGWFCARTPNSFGYVALATRMLPERLQNLLLRRAQPDRKDEDVFPKYYRFNRQRRIRRSFSEYGLQTIVYAPPTPPAYFAGNRVAASFFAAYDELAPEFLKNNLFVFAKKCP